MKKTHQDLTFDSQLGSRAIVEHHEIPQDEYTAELREVLADIGRDLLRTKKVPESMTYKGSFAVHVYQGSLNNFAFAGTLNPAECHYMMADAGLKKLREDVEEYYHGKRRKKRSGF